MPITFAGIPLVPPDGGSAALEYYHAHRIEEFDYPFYNASGLDHLPVPAEPRREPPRIGVLHWPTGASRWAKCHLFVDGAQLARVRTAIGAAPTARPLVLDDGHREITTNMWMLPPRPILQKGVTAAELYLLTLVDDRWWWWQSGNQSAPTNPSSWAGLLSSLFSGLGVSASIDAVPSAYGTPTADRWSVGHKPLPFLIDAACKTVGLRVVRQLDGTVRCQSYATAAVLDAANWQEFQYEVLAGGRLSIADIALSVPASVATVFLGQTPVVFTTTLGAVALPAYGAAAGASGKSAQVIADTPSTAPTVLQALYAVQSATDYYNWSLSLTDCTLRGFWNRPVTGLDDFTEWVDSPTQMVTRVVRSVYSDRNVYGDTTIPSGWVPGLGSGSTQDCDDALQPVTFSCESGTRKALVKSLVVGIEDGKLVVNECEETEYDLGPCSPNNPDGTPLPVAIKVCPVFTTLNYLDHDSQPQTVEVITSLVVTRRLIVVAVADEEGCVTYEPEDCCPGAGSGSVAENQCTTDCSQCGDGMSAVWELTVDGLDPIALTHVDAPDDGNYCRFLSSDLVWDFRYEAGDDLWVLTNFDDGRLWYIDGALFSCFGITNLIPVDDGDQVASVSPVYVCTEITYDCTSGGCVAVAGSGGEYDTLAACQTACTGGGTIETVCCPDHAMSESGTVTFAGDGTGDLACLNGVVVPISFAFPNWVNNVATLCGNVGQVNFQCNTVSGLFALSLQFATHPGNCLGALTDTNCPARRFTFTMTSATSTGSITATVQL